MQRLSGFFCAIHFSLHKFALILKNIISKNLLFQEKHLYFEQLFFELKTKFNEKSVSTICITRNFCTRRV